MVHKKWTIKEELYSLNMQIREFGGPLRKLVYLDKPEYHMQVNQRAWKDFRKLIGAPFLHLQLDTFLETPCMYVL